MRVAIQIERYEISRNGAGLAYQREFSALLLYSLSFDIITRVFFIRVLPLGSVQRHIGKPAFSCGFANNASFANKY
jgi:hypothetical protein